MKKKAIVLVLIILMVLAGYWAWDQSFREEITEQDIELAKYLQNIICSGLTMEQKICKFIMYMINTTMRSIFMPKAMQGLQFSIRMLAILSVQDRAADFRVTYRKITDYTIFRLSDILLDPLT